MTDESARSIALSDAIAHVAWFVETLSFHDEVTGAHYQLDLSNEGVAADAIAAIRSRVIVYTLDGGRYQVTRDASGELAATCDELTFVAADPAWDRGYESGFSDGANDSVNGREEFNSAVGDLVTSARDALADSEGYARTFIAENISVRERAPAQRRIYARIFALRDAIKNVEARS